jgi:hypothetical protein
MWGEGRLGFSIQVGISRRRSKSSTPLSLYASLSIRLSLSLYASLSIRLSLYTPLSLYASLSIRLSLYTPLSLYASL